MKKGMYKYGDRIYYYFPLTEHKQAQCEVTYVVNYDKPLWLIFTSYHTNVIIIHFNLGSNGMCVECTGTYSQTTRKQIGYFLKEYIPELSYYDMKEIAQTGELLDLSQSSVNHIHNLLHKFGLE